MGEPVPGDIADPIYLKGGNVLLDTNEIASKGDWVRYNDTSEAFEQIPKTEFLRVSTNTAKQLQEDINTTGITAKTANAGVLDVGSYIYAKSGEILFPGDKAFLVVYDTGSGVFDYGFIKEVEAAIATITVSSGIAIITTSTPHGLNAGDLTNISGATNAVNEGAFTVLEIISAVEFKVINPIAVAQGSAGGTSTLKASEQSEANATFIKNSGDTYHQESTKNQIGVFSYLGGRA